MTDNHYKTPHLLPSVTHYYQHHHTTTTRKPTTPTHQLQCSPNSSSPRSSLPARSLLLFRPPFQRHTPSLPPAASISQVQSRPTLPPSPVDTASPPTPTLPSGFEPNSPPHPSRSASSRTSASACLLARTVSARARGSTMYLTARRTVATWRSRAWVFHIAGWRRANIWTFRSQPVPIRTCAGSICIRPKHLPQLAALIARRSIASGCGARYVSCVVTYTWVRANGKFQTSVARDKVGGGYSYQFGRRC